MDITTYRIDSELKFHRIISSLDEINIPYTYIKHTDTVFPVLGQTNAYADISIPKEYEKETHEIVKEILNEEPVIVNTRNITNRKKVKIWQIALTGYSLIITIFFLKYWYIYRKNSEDKNFTHEWSIYNTQLILKDKKTGNITQTLTDANFDLNFEATKSFSPDGRQIIESFDRNEDGFMEETYFSTSSGDLTCKNIDSNNNGTIDKIEMVLETKDTLKLFDKDEDGYFETNK